MRIRGCMVEYSLNEAAKILAISSDELKRGVEQGHLRYYYRLSSKGYQFHEASILANRQLLAHRTNYLYTFPRNKLWHCRDDLSR